VRVLAPTLTLRPASATTPPSSTVTPATTAAPATTAPAAAAEPSTATPPGTTAIPPSACTSSGTHSYSGDGIAFAYPSCWEAATYNEPNSFDSYLIDLSSQPLHDPCQTINSPGGGQESECSWPVEQLRPAGIVVVWGQGNMPGWTIAKQPRKAVTVAGQPAREQVSGPGNCSSIVGDEEIDVSIQDPTIDNGFYFMSACLREPDLATMEAQVHQMLNTATING
jgi:hypothetical protein